MIEHKHNDRLAPDERVVPVRNPLSRDILQSRDTAAIFKDPVARSLSGRRSSFVDLFLIGRRICIFLFDRGIFGDPTNPADRSDPGFQDSQLNPPQVQQICLCQGIGSNVVT
jgi:hypothetical protein